VKEDCRRTLKLPNRAGGQRDQAARTPSVMVTVRSA